MKSLPSHPAANLFPDMAAVEYNRLVQDFREHGQREAIYTYQGQILDGRHRYRACQQLGIEPKTEEWRGSDPLAYVLSTNLHRRHLNESQRGMVAARIATMIHGGTGANQHTTGADRSIDRSAPTTEPNKISASKAASMLNVGAATVVRARAILKSEDKDLIDAVDSGQVSVTAGAHVARLSSEERQEVVAQGPKAIAKKGAEVNPDNNRPVPRSSGGKRRSRCKMAGRHFASKGEVMTATEQVNELVRGWEALGGLKELVSTWESKERWKLCDQLELLAKILRKHSIELRHYAKI